MLATNRRFGIEIEAFGIAREAARQALMGAGLSVQPEYARSYTHTVTSYWKTVTDASVSHNGWEAVSPILQGLNGIEEAVKAATALDVAGAQVDRSCGLHVHVDASDLTPEEVKEIVTRYAQYETQIDAFMPASRRGNNNHYCRSVQGLLSNLGPLDRGMRDFLRNFQEEIGSVRYYKINLHAYVRHNTLEFRQHSGTRNAQKIKHWILFVLHFVERCRQIVRQRHEAQAQVQTRAQVQTQTILGDVSDIPGSFRLSEAQRRILACLIQGPQRVEDLCDEIRVRGGRRRATPWTIISYISEIRTLCGVTIRKSRANGYFYLVDLPRVTQTISVPASAPTPAPISIEPDTLFTGIPQEVVSFYEERAQEFAC